MLESRCKENLGKVFCFFALFVWLTISQDSVAQTVKNHHIGFNAGFADYQTRDLVDSVAHAVSIDGCWSRVT